MTEELVNYIKESLAQGIPQDQIRQTLITSGWQSADIDAAFNQLQSPQPITPPIYQPISSKPSFNLKLLLIGILVLILLASAGGGAYLYFTKKADSGNTELNQSELNSNKDTSSSQTEKKLTPTPSASNVPISIDTSAWITFPNSTLGYSLKIPPSWKQKTTTSDNQIKFEDETGKVELQILTLAYNDPAFSGDLGEYNRLLVGESGKEYEIEGTSVKKIQNLTLDKCNAVQVLILSEKAGYSTTCIGKNRYITLLLTSGILNIDQVVEFKSSYDAILTTFKFNQFTLD